jgi:aspartyl-tRNA(Asn)/glutamyl-tRNA(Gln) amidotransferase subunit B
MAYRPTIGLEVHAELNTRTKMFCDSKNDPDETRPNVNVCPVCMAHPGTLPVINREAVRHVLRLGNAVGGELATFSEFDRKSYFYPDIPKGYQISQYEYPLVVGGELAGVTITRVHLEEDTARSLHAEGKTLVDYNRAGIPLMELVTEPVIHDATTAGRFARELQLLLRTLGAGEANLEKGEMRVEANISVSQEEGKFGTKVEVKNLNSFRSVERAIAFEIDRQTALIESGGKVVQETRGWNEATEETFHQRFKEGSADYRYFPEPDLPKLSLREVSTLTPDALRATLPELPWDKRARLIDRGVTEEAAEILVSDPLYAEVYEREIAIFTDDKEHSAAVNILLGEVRGKSPDRDKLNHLQQTFAKVIPLLVSGALSSTSAKASIVGVLERGGEPLVQLQLADETELIRVVTEVLAEQEEAVAEYRQGKTSILQFLVGQAMKRSKGAGNPAAFIRLIQEQLN